MLIRDSPFCCHFHKSTKSRFFIVPIPSTSTRQKIKMTHSAPGPHDCPQRLFFKSVQGTLSPPFNVRILYFKMILEMDDPYSLDLPMFCDRVENSAFLYSTRSSLSFSFSFIELIVSKSITFDCLTFFSWPLLNTVFIESSAIKCKERPWKY